MIYLIIISGIAFTIGNVLWDKFGIDEPKLFFVPLAVFIASLLSYAMSKLEKGITRLLVQYLFILSLGNIVKQLFYSEQIKQINDYIFGGVVTVWLFLTLIKTKQWETKK